ncbi:MAG: Uma2 family endonuclease [Chloroflexi bacterium]|nr:Uma2 family endonuclease [Chloroflexota bacterium]
MSAQDIAYIAAPTRLPPAGKLSFEEFHDWLDEDTWAEWVKGEVQMVSPARRHHQEVTSLLLIVFRFWAEAHERGTVLQAPFLMRLPEPPGSAREPDLLFVAREHLDRLRPTYLDGPADLVVEVMSPESLARDRGDKYVEYEQAGIREYWLIDPDRRQAEFYQLGPEGHFHLAAAGREGTFESTVLRGLKLPIEWLWADSMPTATEAVRSLGLIR